MSSNKKNLQKLALKEFLDIETEEDNEVENGYIDVKQLFAKQHSDRCEWCLPDGKEYPKRKTEGERYCHYHLRMDIRQPLKQARVERQKAERLHYMAQKVNEAGREITKALVFEDATTVLKHKAEIGLKLLSDRGIDISA